MKILRLFVSCLVLCAVSVHLKGQVAFEKSDHVISAGYSFFQLHPKYLEKQFAERNRYGNQYGAYGIYTFYESTAHNPLNLKYEAALSSHLGLGISLGYFKTTVDEKITYYGSTDGYHTFYNYENLSAAVRINYHFGSSKKFDPYIGAAIGYAYFHITQDPPQTKLTGTPLPDPTPWKTLDFSLSAGLRYYLYKPIAIYVEAGFDHWAIAQAGVAFRFR